MMACASPLEWTELAKGKLSVQAAALMEAHAEICEACAHARRRGAGAWWWHETLRRHDVMHPVTRHLAALIEVPPRWVPAFCGLVAAWTRLRRPILLAS